MKRNVKAAATAAKRNVNAATTAVKRAISPSAVAMKKNVNAAAVKKKVMTATSFQITNVYVTRTAVQMVMKGDAAPATDVSVVEFLLTVISAVAVARTKKTRM